MESPEPAIRIDRASRSEMGHKSVTEIRPHDDVLLIAIRRSSLDDVSSQALFDEALQAASDRPRVPLVLDMQQVRFAPSVAIGHLVELANALKFERRRLVLVGLHDRVRGAISVMRLDRLFEIFPTLDDLRPRPDPTER